MKIVAKQFNPFLFAANILDAYRAAGPDVVDYGRQWYFNAHEIARLIADAYGLPLETVVGVMAVTSPSVEWLKNIQNTVKLIKYGSAAQGVTAYKRMVAHALAILDGAHPLTVINGLKSKSFYDNIYNPENSLAVTVDRHAVRAALGEEGKTMKADDAEKYVASQVKYDVFVSAYRMVADHLGEIAHAVQAVTWTSYRLDYSGSVVQVYMPTLAEQIAYTQV